MRSSLILIISTFILFFATKVNFGQTAPNLGECSHFAIFTANGTISNIGATSIKDDIGSNSDPITGFPPGIVDGYIYTLPDVVLVQAALDVASAYSDLTQGGAVIGVGLGNGQILLAGIYQTGAASTLNGNLILAAEGDPNALFIIRIGGAFVTGISSTVTLVNSASLCNVYWQIGGQFDLGDGSVFRGNAIVDGAINLFDGAFLFGRGLSRAGAISLQNNLVNPMVTIAAFSPATSTRCQGAGTVTSTTNASNNSDPIVYSLDATTAAFTGNSIDTATGEVTYSEGWSGTTIVTASVAGCDGPVTTTLMTTIYPLPLTSLIYHY